MRCSPQGPGRGCQGRMLRLDCPGDNQARHRRNRPGAPGGCAGRPRRTKASR
jgi:hypothetical protein